MVASSRGSQRKRGSWDWSFPWRAAVFYGIEGTSAALDSGGQATAQSYEDMEFKDPTFVHYPCNPRVIQAANSGKRIAKSGRWEGIWQKSEGVTRKSSIYLAKWVPVGGAWRLKSEGLTEGALVIFY